MQNGTCDGLLSHLTGFSSAGSMQVCVVVLMAKLLRKAMHVFVDLENLYLQHIFMIFFILFFYRIKSEYHG